jgi:hypothetical protein
MAATVTSPAPSARRLSASRRKLLLTIHIAASTALVGVVATAIALDVHALTSDDRAGLRGAFSFFDIADRTVFPPLAVAALVTGVILSYGTIWNLHRYPWVLVKLVLTIALVATGIALVNRWTGDALDALEAGHDPSEYVVRLLAVSAAHLAAVLLATVLSVYKPWGLAPWASRMAGRRTSHSAFRPKSDAA